MTKQRMLQKKTLINNFKSRVPQHTSSAVEAGYNTIRFKCLKERLEPNLRQLWRTDNMQTCLKSAGKYVVG